jgi:hypothetical protein
MHDPHLISPERSAVARQSCSSFADPPSVFSRPFDSAQGALSNVEGFEERGCANKRPTYNARVVTRGIREFVTRDWGAARANKDAYWGERIARLGPIEALRVAEELRCQVRLWNPAWPDASLRQADLTAHVRLAELFHRAGSARRT